MGFKGVIFDLDGTLVNSLFDISDALNFALSKHGFPEHREQDVEQMVGNGIRKLVWRALPESDRNEEYLELCLKDMLQYYEVHCVDKTKAYDGIHELVKNMKVKGIKLGVLSNKADALTYKVVSKIFPNEFDSVRGLISEKTKKPHPFGAKQIAASFRLQPEEVLFIGDSDVDIQTAKNAGMKSAGVVWGYRNKEELKQCGADFIVEKAGEILNIVIP